MKEYPIVLLPAPERRPAAEGWVWFVDGLRLLKVRLAAWTTYAVAAVAALMMASLLGSAVSAIGGENPALLFDLPRLLLVSMVVVAVQVGMFRGMTRIAQSESLGERKGASIQLNDMVWLFSAPQRKHLLTFAVIMVVFNLVFALFEQMALGGQALLVPNASGEFVINDARYTLNMTVFWRYAMMMSMYTVLLWMLTWAAVPLMTLFAELPPLRALLLTMDGCVKNFLPLLMMGVLMLMLSITVGLGIGLIGSLAPVLSLPLLLLFMVWMLPLGSAWAYAACRHVFTDW